MKELFETLGHEEKEVIQGFVWHGGTFIRWKDANNSSDFPSSGIDSLVSRELIYVSMTADGMQEGFVLDAQLFAYAQSVLPKVPF